MGGNTVDRGYIPYGIWIRIGNSDIHPNNIGELDRLLKIYKPMILGGMLTGWTYEGRKLYSSEEREIVGHNYITHIHRYVAERILETGVVTINDESSSRN